MQLSSTPVITQSLPMPQHILLGRRRKFFNGWKGLDKTLVVRNDRGDLGLLQHDFADPDQIRIAGSTPGKFARIASKPRQNSLAKHPLPRGVRMMRHASTTAACKSTSPAR